VKRIIVFAGLILSAVFSVKAADNYVYLQIKMLDENKENIFSDNVVGGCFVGPGESCEGIYLVKSDGNTYAAFGDINHDQRDVVYELLYSLTVFEENSGIHVNGSVYTVNFRPGTDSIVSGEKKEFNKDIELNRKYQFLGGYLPYGKKVYLEINATGGWEPVSISSGKASNLELKSTLLHDNRVYGSHAAAQMFQDEPNVFESRFQLPAKNDSHTEYMHYMVKIRFSEELNKITRPTDCRITFQRMYMIDTLKDVTDNRYDMGYFSSFEKEIALSPGKELKIIFPPDTPSVRGFDIEDTLMIKP
jgi:hypothetical protein